MKEVAEEKKKFAIEKGPYYEVPAIMVIVGWRKHTHKHSYSAK
jgi:hypothetical protein